MYLKYIGPNSRGFCCRSRNAQRIFDCPLENPIYKYKTGENSYSYSSTNYGNYIECYNDAHPNIKFKGDKTDENCKNSFTMVKYVVKQIDYLDRQHWAIVSNFDWYEYYLDLKNKFENKPNKNSTKRFYRKNKNGEVIDEETSANLEYSFCSYLWDIVNDGTNKTIKEIKQLIFQDKDLWFIYASKYNNYSAFLNEIIKSREVPKPRMDYNNKFWIPWELYNYITKILDPFVEAWFTTKDKTKLPHRPKGLWLTGKSRSGKTSLMVLLGTFSYFKNIWNALDFDSTASYNIMDDFDNEITKFSEFNYLKPWVGAQDTMSITDKYVKKIDVVNGKPLIFINNNPLEEQVTSKAALKYIRENMFVIELGDQDLYTPKDRRTIGGYCNWVHYDPKTCWYYRNIYCHLEAAQNCIDFDDNSFIDEVTSTDSISTSPNLTPTQPNPSPTPSPNPSIPELPEPLPDLSLPPPASGATTVDVVEPPTSPLLFEDSSFHVPTPTFSPMSTLNFSSQIDENIPPAQSNIMFTDHFDPKTNRMPISYGRPIGETGLFQKRTHQISQSSQEKKRTHRQRIN